MLELKNVSFSVDGDGKQKDIVKNVSFTVEDNKFAVITGPNGGGKSTIAKLIAGIEKPVSGQILLDGQDITDKSITAPDAPKNIEAIKIFVKSKC